MKNPFKKALKKAQKAEAQAPRAKDEILKEYNDIKSRLADSQYQVFVHSKTAEELNYRMLVLNQEAAKRQALDAAATKERGIKWLTLMEDK